MNVFVIDAHGAELAELLVAEHILTTERPLLRVAIYQDAMRARGDEPSALHRYLADLGYVPSLDSEADGVEWWTFHHPDGTRP